MYYMTVHLLEAIFLNLKRLPKYAKISGGKSIPVSLMLISSEILSLLTAIIMDFRARYWQKRGVPVFEHEFIPMSKTPSFKGDLVPPGFERLPQYKYGKKELEDLLKARNLKGLSEALEKRLNELGAFQGIFCMTRHTLESFLRSSNLAAMHIERAAQKNVKSPESFCLQNLKAHLLALDFCMLLDKVAFTVQKDGLLIVGNDVPHIPPMPETY